MDELQARLKRLIDQRPYVFRDTPQDVAEAYLRTEQTFVGLREEEVVALERSLGVTFPQDFRAYLLHMGKQTGLLFTGSDIDPWSYGEYKRNLADIIADEGIPSFLTPRSVVFLQHQGYSYLFFEADNPTTSVVWSYAEGDEEPTRLKTITAVIESELTSWEQLYESQRASGGYYLSVWENGIVRAHHPPRSEGRRPIDEGDVWA
jgi:hypothetical protein